MKKTFILGLTTMLTLGSLAPVAHAENVNENNNYLVEINELESYSLDESTPSFVLEVAPYVYKNEQGLLSIDNNISEDMYIKNNVEELEESFKLINEQVLAGKLTINDDLSITSNNMITTFSSNSKGYTSKKYWWGEKATYTNKQAKAAVKQTNSAAIDTALIGAGTLLIPVYGPGFAPIVGLTSAYLFNLADDMSKANKGKGIVVNMTWAFVYTVKSR